MSNLKKVFILSLAILIVTLGSWLFLFFKPSATPNDNPTPENTSTTFLGIPIRLPNAVKITALSDEAILSPALSSDDKYIYYLEKNTGKVFKMNSSGEEKTMLLDKNVPGIKEAYWSKDLASVITKTANSNGETQFTYHNFDSNADAIIKKSLDNVSWQSSSSRIFYKYFDQKTKSRTLNTSDPDGSNWKKLTDISHRDIIISQIPGSSAVSFWNSPDAFVKTSLETMPIAGGEKKILFSDKFGADYLWNNVGKWSLVSHSDVQNGSKIQLATINQNGGEYRNLAFATFVSKCVWAKDNLTAYCALPEGMPEKAVLPNDYNNNSFSTIDTFWKINTKTGEKSKIELPKDNQENFDAKNLFLDSKEKYLFFVNKINGKLYKMTL